jgi:hypothetical protein
MTIPALSDRELQCVRVSLELLRSVKQQQVSENKIKAPVNEFDLLDSRHTLMHTLTALAKFTQTPISHFENPNPSQTPETE